MTFFNVLPLLNALFCLGIGLYVLSRNWKIFANLGFFVGMAALGLMEFAAYMGASTHHGVYASATDKMFGAGEILLLGSWFVFSLSFARVDASREFKRWSAVSIPLFALSGLFLFLSVTENSLLENVTSVGVGFWVSVFLVVSLTINLANLESTLRSADPARRRKIKILLLGVGTILAFQIYMHSQYLLLPRLEQDFSAVQSTILFIACLLVTYSLARHQLMDVDVFVSRSFIYKSVTVGAVGIYLLGIGLAGQAIRSVGGIPAVHLKSLFGFLTVLFLIAVLLSHRIQKTVKIFIERNFYRHKYDYHEEWLALTDKLSSKLKVQDLLPAIANTFLQTLWIENTCLWLYDDREEEFQAVATSPGESVAPIRWDPVLLDALRERDSPVPVDEWKNLPDGAGIDREQVDALRGMGISILSPMIVKNRFVGILGLSGTLSTHPLDDEDYDLIRTVSKQAASSFLSARLLRDLVQAKEMETFHAFSAFVMHDLKNFVSMLSLVVHNAKGNFGNPEFREDALRSISLTVEKMKRMMDRLAVLSRPLEVERMPADLNDVVRGSLSGLNGALGSKVVAEFGKIPTLALDPAQIAKVVTNLLLNAAEATGAGGNIRLSTAEGAGGWVVLTVSDDGCGMPPEFIERRLFKPFSTTKSGGFGIGLYQVKEIVEAHAGRIEVESDVGRGSSFRVLLPAETV
jgi:putative PEP-CTERM system histidine kinase